LKEPTELTKNDPNIFLFMPNSLFFIPIFERNPATSSIGPKILRLKYNTMKGRELLFLTAFSVLDPLLF
jgi:hypothetical protein